MYDVCKSTNFCGRNLSELPGFETEVTRMLEVIEAKGAYALFPL